MPFTEEARKLKQKRTTIKANLTRFCKYLDSCDSFSDSFELNVRLENANKWLEEFDLYQGKLEELSSVDDRDQDANELEREQFERSFYSAIAKAKSILNSITNSTTNQPIPQAFSVSSNPLANVKLPPLDLPQFDGKLEELSSVDDRDQDANELEREQFERSFYSAIAKAKSILNSITNSTTNQPIPQAFSVSSNPLAN
ncbi:hypothetical protein HUJ04_011714, partial [Dendroctonus ponderosae]